MVDKNRPLYIFKYLWDNTDEDHPAIINDILAHLETNGIGKFLPALLRQEFARHRVPCAVLEEVSRRNKGERILSALDPVLMNGALWVHNRVRQTPLVREMRDFTPDGTAHDDGLDAVAGCLLCEPVRLQRPPRYGLQYKTEWRF